MRLSLFLFLFIMVSYVSEAQVPNGDFENWNNGLPDSWLAVNIPGYESITQTDFSHSGSSALSGKVVLWPGIGLYGPAIYADPGTGMGFPVSQKYNSLKGYYAFKPNGGDIIIITVLFTDANSTTATDGGSVELSAASDNYIPFAVPISPFTDAVPAACHITITLLGPSTGGDYHEGSQFFFDDLELSMDVVSGINDKIIAQEFSLRQNYPNPFNPTTNIRYQIPINSHVLLKIYDVLGNEVATLVNEYKPAGGYEVKFNAAGLSSGIYFYVLNIGGKQISKKMVLLK